MSADNRISAGSLLYGLHPAVKLFVFICIIQMASVSYNVFSFLFFSALFTGLTIYSGLDAKTLAAKLKPFTLLLAVTFAINFIFSGIALSAVLTSRFLLIILFSLLLTLTSDTRQLITVLLSPFRGKHGDNLRVVFMVAMEFIPVFIQEAKKTAAIIKDKYPEKTYKAAFRPELYIKPMAEKMADMSEDVAEDVRQGNYEASAIVRPELWEYGLALSVFALTVKYAL